MRGRMGGMSLKKLIIASLFVAQPCFIAGCYDLSSGDRNAKALGDRMKQIEKDASKVHSGRHSDSPKSGGE
jgi:hypothetical protein